MRNLGYLFLGLAVFVVSVVATAPLQFVLDRAAVGQAIHYSHASGSIWKGRVSGLVVDGQPVGDLDIKADFRALLKGSLAYDVDVRGELANAKARAAIRMNGDVSVSNLIADLDVRQLVRLDPRLRTQPSRLGVTVIEGRWSMRGACRSLNGDIDTDILSAMGRVYDWNGPELAGVMECQDGQTVVRLDGAGSADQIAVEGRFAPPRDYVVTANVQTSNETLATILQTLEFKRNGSRFAYSKSNATMIPEEDENA